MNMNIIVNIIIQTGMIEEYGKLMVEQASAGKSWSLKQVVKKFISGRSQAMINVTSFTFLLLLLFLV